MNKINFYLESRLANVKKQAIEWAKFNPDSAYKNALNHQVKYKRKGWNSNDTANHYNNGSLYLENLVSYSPVEISKLFPRTFDYTGYFADNFQHELIKPYIVRITTKKGLFVCPAIAFSESDTAIIYFSRGEFCSKDTDSINYESSTYQVARIADSLAESIAEDCRENDAKNQAESLTDDLKAENLQARKEAHALILAIKDQRKIGDIVAPICNALISEIRSIRQTIRANNQRISKLKADYWQAVI